MSLISVIVPTFNRAHLIPDTIHSIFGQTGDFELIIVDDGSNDNTLSYLNLRFGAQVRLYSTQCFGGKKGVSFSRNIGADYAIGDYLVFCDSDDLMLPGRLKFQSSFLQENRAADIVFGNEFALPGSDLVVYKKRFRPFLTAPSIGEFRRVKDYFGQAPRIGNPVVRTAMIRKELFMALGGFNESMMIGEDHEFIARLALNSDLYYSDLPLQVVRKGPYDRLSGRAESIYSGYRQLVSKLEETTVDEIRRRDYVRLINGWKLEAVLSAARDVGNTPLKECIRLLKQDLSNISIVRFTAFTLRVLSTRLRESMKLALSYLAKDLKF